MLHTASVHVTGSSEKDSAWFLHGIRHQADLESVDCPHICFDPPMNVTALSCEWVTLGSVARRNTETLMLKTN